MTLSAAGKNTSADTRSAGELIAAHETMLRQPNLPDWQSAQLWRTLAHLLIQQNAFDRALEALFEAVTRQPDQAETFFDLGNLLFRMGNADAAVSAFRQAATLAPDNAAVWHNYGNALSALQIATTAESCFREAVRLEPRDTAYLKSLAVHLLHLGKKSEARQAFALLVDIDPSNGPAHLNLAGLKRFEAHDLQIARMETCLSNPATTAEDRITLGFALFKAFDDLKEHGRAFANLEEANRRKRGSLDYDMAIEERAFSAMKDFFTEDFFRRHHRFGADEIAPIFIVGMPRSGTTLTEQILSSHSTVAAGGEAAAMSDLVGGFLGSAREQGLALTEEKFSAERSLEMGRHYAGRMRDVAGLKPRFTDKMPLNFRWIGIIAAILPKARFVHCVRNPLENCFSIYSSYFSSEGNRYAYDQDELGRYYRHYRSLMDHWQAVLPNRIHDVRLDGLVADQEAATRRLLDFCGLAFEPACLDFHRNTNRVTTLSAMQVRQPIYGGQDERIRPYLPQLDPLRTALGPLG